MTPPARPPARAFCSRSSQGARTLEPLVMLSSWVVAQASGPLTVRPKWAYDHRYGDALQAGGAARDLGGQVDRSGDVRDGGGGGGRARGAVPRRRRARLLELPD